MEEYTVETNFGETYFSTLRDALHGLWIALTYASDSHVDSKDLKMIKEIVLSGETWTDGSGIIAIYRSN